jgi:hypothetical protein
VDHRISTTQVLRDINAFICELHPSKLSDNTVWVATCDTFEIGNTDLDNETTTVAVYATLEAAARDLPIKMAQPGARIFHPILTQMAVVS